MIQAAPQMNVYNGEMPEPIEIDNEILNRKPTAPSMLYTDKGQTYSLPIKNIQIISELHVATAFVRMNITFQNTINKKINCLFAFPTNGTVTSCEANIGGYKYVDTTFIPTDEAQKVAKKSKPKKGESDEVN